MGLWTVFWSSPKQDKKEKSFASGVKDFLYMDAFAI